MDLRCQRAGAANQKSLASPMLRILLDSGALDVLVKISIRLAIWSAAIEGNRVVDRLI